MRTPSFSHYLIVCADVRLVSLVLSLSHTRQIVASSLIRQTEIISIQSIQTQKSREEQGKERRLAAAPPSFLFFKMADVSMTPADDSSTSIPITLPPDVSMNVVLASFDHLPPQWKEQISHIQLTEQLILNPTPTIINTLYKVLIHFPALLKDHEDLEKIQAEKVQRDAEVESALNEAERLRSEAHQRFESQRLQKEELEKQYSQVYGKVASLESELNALKSSNATQSGGLADQNAEFKARLESVEEEKRGLLNELEREKTESNRRGGE